MFRPARRLRSTMRNRPNRCLTPGDVRTGHRDSRHRDVVRRDGRGARHAGRGHQGQRRRVAGRPARAVRRRRARGRVSPPPRARRRPSIREALAQADATLDDVDRVAVTQGPGLIGALLVGLAAAKALAWARRLPLVPVDHLDGHIASLYLQPAPVEPPFLCLLASGGHTMLSTSRATATQRILGTTLDDAAGEAFDKGARLLGLGYPGGREIDRLAREGDPDRLRLPRRARARASTSPSPGSRPRSSTRREKLSPEELERRRADLAASYQRAIVRALVERVREAARADRRGPDRGRGRRCGQLRAPRGARRRGSRAARAHDRQRGDDRLGRPLHRARPVPRLSWA